MSSLVSTALSEHQQSLLERFKSSLKRSSLRFNKIKLINKKIDDLGNANEEFGKFFAVSFDGEREIKKEINIENTEFFILKARVQPRCSKYEKNAAGKKTPQFIVQEVDEGEEISVYEKSGTFEVARGAYKSLKEKFSLKYVVVLYVIMQEAIEDGKVVVVDKNVYRWEIKIGANCNLFEIKSKLAALNAEGVMKGIKISEVREINNEGIWFNAVDYGISDREFPTSVVVDYWARVDEYFNSSKKGVKPENTSPEPLPEPSGESEIDEHDF